MITTSGTNTRSRRSPSLPHPWQLPDVLHDSQRTLSISDPACTPSFRPSSPYPHGNPQWPVTTSAWPRPRPPLHHPSLVTLTVSVGHSWHGNTSETHAWATPKTLLRCTPTRPAVGSRRRAPPVARPIASYPSVSQHDARIPPKYQHRLSEPQQHRLARPLTRCRPPPPSVHGPGARCTGRRPINTAPHPPVSHFFATTSQNSPTTPPGAERSSAPPCREHHLAVCPPVKVADAEDPPFLPFSLLPGSPLSFPY
nr:uncharacterized protein LOC127330251 [Lolium perenne]